MDTNELEVLSKTCWRNRELSEKAEAIVAKVIATIWNKTFRMNDLEIQIQEFREIAEQERINLSGINDSDLYNFIIRPAAGCRDNSN